MSGERVKCINCESEYKLYVAGDGQWWCPKCLNNEVARLRNAIQKHKDNFPNGAFHSYGPLGLHEHNEELWTCLERSTESVDEKKTVYFAEHLHPDCWLRVDKEFYTKEQAEEYNRPVEGLITTRVVQESR